MKPVAPTIRELEVYIREHVNYYSDPRCTNDLVYSTRDDIRAMMHPIKSLVCREANAASN